MEFYRILAGTSAVMLLVAVGCSDGPRTLGTGPTGSTGTGSATGSGGSGAGGDSTSGAGGDSATSSSSQSSSSTTTSSASGQGGNGFVPYAAPDVGVQDVNATSTTFGQTVSAMTFTSQVSGWFFGQST